MDNAGAALWWCKKTARCTENVLKKPWAKSKWPTDHGHLLTGRIGVLQEPLREASSAEALLTLPFTGRPLAEDVPKACALDHRVVTVDDDFRAGQHIALTGNGIFYHRLTAFLMGAGELADKTGLAQ